ncbi:thiamine-phosphate kinase [Citricoccus sp. NPDC079358]|uniref:thiamine-phosphate kinase n=1 Tax=Citricoccus sp. NPDC079358 TaxID=3154653 RepID=UPI003450BEED
MTAPGTTPTPRARQTVGGLGESGILRILNRRFATVPAAGDWPEGTVGPGDDAAVVSAPDGRFVITTDAMAQDRDFRLDWPAVPRGLASRSDGRTEGGPDGGSNGGRFDGHGFAGGYATGWKAAAQNLSDINAMGGEPSGLLLALTMPPTTPVAWIDGLAAGLAGAVRHLGAARCRIVGGDLGSDDRITVAVTATGDLDGRPAVRRTLPPAACAGTAGVDLGLDLVLCGRAGWAAAGLAVLETPRGLLDERLRIAEGAEQKEQKEQKEQAEQGDQLDHGVRRLAALAAAAQLRPRPVLGAGRVAAEAGALAMMDVSDGVLKDAGRLATTNGLRADLDPDWVRREASVLVPLARALDPASGQRTAECWVSAGGEDYGLLAALPTGATVPPGFRRIGRLVAESGAPAAAASLGSAGGWDHFTDR